MQLSLALARRRMVVKVFIMGGDWLDSGGWGVMAFVDGVIGG